MIVGLCIVVAVVIGIVGVKMVTWAIATQAATTQRYAHLDAYPLHRAAEQIGGRIAAAMGEPIRKPAGKVVPLRR
jgi:hypothetical protein